MTFEEKQRLLTDAEKTMQELKKLANA